MTLVLLQHDYDLAFPLTCLDLIARKNELNQNHGFYHYIHGLKKLATGKTGPTSRMSSHLHHRKLCPLQKTEEFVNKHIKKAKPKNYTIYFNQQSEDSRKQWQMINTLINKCKSKRKIIINKLIIDNKEITLLRSKLFTKCYI